MVCKNRGIYVFFRSILGPDYYGMVWPPLIVYSTRYVVNESTIVSHFGQIDHDLDQDPNREMLRMICTVQIRHSLRMLRRVPSILAYA